tara:strand:- start:14522 stop:14704 length:183 start_codon:yes stop_codon:yes gene_type:complete
VQWQSGVKDRALIFIAENAGTIFTPTFSSYSAITHALVAQAALPVESDWALSLALADPVA